MIAAMKKCKNCGVWHRGGGILRQVPPARPDGMDNQD